MKLKKTFSLTVFSPFQTYYEGPATLLSGVNKSGPFDILADHANFLCLLTPCELNVETANGQQKFAVQRGIVEVTDTNTYVFVNI
ncbi:MAG: F0F1 ATP synthase subunit epsilon [Candidatus Saccharibacteria bacterium]